FAAVHHLDLHTGRHAGLRRRFVGKNIRDCTLAVKPQSDRVRNAEVSSNLFAIILHFAGSVAIHQAIATGFESAEWSVARSRVVDTGIKETIPVVRRDRIQRAHDVIERVRLHFGRTAYAAMESAAEVVERLLVLSLLADDGVSFEPD